MDGTLNFFIAGQSYGQKHKDTKVEAIRSQMLPLLLTAQAWLSQFVYLVAVNQKIQHTFEQSNCKHEF